MIVSDEAPIRLHLVGGFAIDVSGVRVSLHAMAQRLVAMAALAAPAPLRRTTAAGTLWGDHSDARAAANLRNTMWRLQRTCPGLIGTSNGDLFICPGVWVDITSFDSTLADDDREMWPAGELLPGWADEWLVVERERVRLSMVYALERFARAALANGDHARTVELGMRAIAAEPLRETSTRIVIDAHLADGNTADAIFRYRQFEKALAAELGIDPSPQLSHLAQQFGPLISVSVTDQTPRNADGATALLLDGKKC